MSFGDISAWLRAFAPWRTVATASVERGRVGKAPLSGRVVIALAIAWLTIGVMPAAAQITNGVDLGDMSLPQAQLACRNSVNTTPWLSGIAKAQPGRWWNPKRYGTGWDLVYSDDRKKLKVFLYTYSANGHPVWLATKMKPIDEVNDSWRADLYEYTKDASTNVVDNTGSDVGEVYFRFFRDDPSRLAMRWHWNEIPSAGQPSTGYFEECLNDMTRLNPTYYTGLSSVDMETKQFFDTSSSSSQGLNQTFSGYWSDLDDVDKMPGVVMTVMQTSLGNQEGHFGEAAVWLTFNENAEAGKKRPIFMQAQRTQLLTSLPFDSSTFDLYLHYSIGYPSVFPTSDCVSSNNPDGSNGCVSNHLIGSYTRSFRADSDYRRALVSYALDPVLAPGGVVTNPKPGRTSVKLPSDQSMLVNRMTRLQDISVNRYVCAPPAPTFPGEQTTCTIFVSWSGNGIGKPWKRDLGSMSYDTAPISLDDTGVEPVSLKTGDRFQFELWQGTPGAPGSLMLDRAPEVRGVSSDSANPGAITLPDAPIVSNAEDKPAHDPTVGAMAGSADVSGGAATYTVPLQVPPGRNGMQPSLSLNYSSRAGNGVAGLGWSLSAGGSIHRCPRTLAQDGVSRGVQLDGDDRLCLDGQRLMTEPGSPAYGNAGAVYRTEIDSFAKVLQSGGSLAGGGACFTVLQKDGRKLSYGCIPAGQQGCQAPVAPRVQTSVKVADLSWLLSRVEDPSGNTMEFCYGNGGGAGEVILKRIAYTGSTKAGLPAPSRYVDFTYGARPTDWRANDRSSAWIAGGGTEQTQRLTAVTTSADSGTTTVRQYVLGYDDPATELPYSYTSGRSLLRQIQECVPGSGCLAPTKFTWTDGTWMFENRKFTVSPPPAQQPAPATGMPAGEEERYTPDYKRNTVQAIGDLDGDGSRELWIVKSWYDGTPRTEVQLAKVNADRAVQGIVTLTGMVPFARAADIDGDGITELVGNTTIYKWKRGRGAPVCDGGATSCTADAASYFQVVTTNLPTGTYDFIDGIVDFNGDGAPDVLVRSGLLNPCPQGSPELKSNKDSVILDGCAPIYIYVNNRSGAIGAGTSSYTFTRSEALGTLSANGSLAESVQHLTDFDGDGHTDLVIANTTGIQRILRIRPNGSSLSSAELSLAAAGFTGDTRQLRWLDVNGDGLDDVLTVTVPASPANCSRTECFGFWRLQLNRGGVLGPAATLSGATTAGLRYDGVDGAVQLRYFGKMLQSDIDSDGRGDLLYPAHLAARICFGAYLANSRFLTPRPAKDCPVQADHGATCEADVCAAPPPEDGNTWVDHPSGQIDAADAFKSGLGAYDPSVYRFNALRFVQTGENAFRLQTDESPVIAATSVLGNQAGRIDDYFGDGLADVVSDVTCPLRPTSLFPLNTCHLYSGGTAGPGSTDGTSYLDSASTIRLNDLVSSSNINLLINENQGDGPRGAGLPPMFPDLLGIVVNALNDRAEWQYYPLSSKADRSGSDFPLYQIDTGYVDQRHFLFQSSMPVVSQLSRSHAASGGTSGLTGDGSRSVRYSYGGAMYNRDGRGFQGFRTIASEILGPTDRRVRSVTTFHQKFPLTGRIESVETRVPEITGPNGRLSLGTQTWACDRANRASICPGQDGSAPTPGLIHWPYLASGTQQVYDLARAEVGAAPLLLSTTTTTNGNPSLTTAGWDEYGNLTYQQVVMQDGAGAIDGDRYYLANHTTLTVNTYDTSPSALAAWWIDKLTTNLTHRTVSYHGRTAPASLNLPPKRIVKQFDWNPDRTLNTLTITDPYFGMTLQTTYGYPTPSAGQPTTMTVAGTDIAPARETRTIYTSDGYFPYSVTAVLSVANSALNHTTTTVVRASDGQPISTTDANGVETRSNYDGFGRLLSSRLYGNDGRPLAPARETSLKRCSPCSAGDESFAAYYQSTVADGAPSQRVWFDILGREVKRATRGFDGRWVNVATHYDSQGSVRETSVPYFTGEAPLYTQMTYDRSNRVRTKRAPTAELNTAQGDLLTTYTYDGLITQIDVRPAAGVGPCIQNPNLCLTMSRQHNALGQLMRTTDTQNGLTDYWLDPMGNAAALRDANGRATLATYNGFGHRLSFADPNQGNWSFTYNALNELLTQTDARGVKTSVVQRDALGRVLVQRREPLNGVLAGMTDEKVQDTWVYDSAGVKGQLASAERRTSNSAGEPASTPMAAWSEIYSYSLDSARLKTRTTTIAGGPLVPFTNTYDYDSYYGYLKGVSYSNSPQPLTVWKRYTRYGALTGLVDARQMTPLWSMSQANAYGKPTEEQFGYALTGTTNYARSTGQMLSQAWRPFDEPTFPGNLESIDYRYDVLGNLTSQERQWRRYDLGARHHNVLLSTTTPGYNGRGLETYRYDTLQRLVSVERRKNGLHLNAQGSLEWSDMPADPLQIGYQYDAVGNILAKSDYASSYVYGDATLPEQVGVAGKCGPNALRQTFSGDHSRSYECDRNGNQILETVSGYSGLRTVSFDGANLATHVEHSDPWNGFGPNDGYSFAYGPDNARYRETKGNSVTGSQGLNTYFGADGYELEVRADGSVLHRMELGPVVYTRQVSGQASNSTASPPLVGYQLRDRLGSVIGVADRWGDFNGTDPGAPFPVQDGLTRRFFDPFGAPRYADFANTASMPELRLSPATLRGFTGHEHIDGARLIHMNGRMFDYRSGRFLSVDPIIQAPANSQSLNAYSYIGNNPLGGRDPSGYAACDDDGPKEGEVCHITKTTYAFGSRTATSYTVTIANYNGALYAAPGKGDVANQMIVDAINGVASRSNAEGGGKDLAVHRPVPVRIREEAPNGFMCGKLGERCESEYSISEIGPSKFLASLGDHIGALLAPYGTIATNPFTGGYVSKPHLLREGTAVAILGLFIPGPSKVGDELVTVYRGTNLVSEIQIFKESGAVLSDAGRIAYQEARMSGRSISESLILAERFSAEAHANQTRVWGNLNNYIEAHGAFGQEVSIFGPRSMVSFTTDPKVARQFGETLMQFEVPRSLLHPQTLRGAGESEVLIINGVRQ